MGSNRLSSPWPATTAEISKARALRWQRRCKTGTACHETADSKKGRLPDDNVATNPAARLRVETFEPSEDHPGVPVTRQRVTGRALVHGALSLTHRRYQAHAYIEREDR